MVHATLAGIKHTSANFEASLTGTLKTSTSIDAISIDITAATNQTLVDIW